MPTVHAPTVGEGAADVPAGRPTTTTTLSLGQTAPIRIHHLTESLCADPRALRRLLPEIAAEAIKRCANPRADAADIAAALARDPSFSVHVMAVIDAGIFAPRDPKSSGMAEGLRALDLQSLRDLVLAATIRGLARRAAGFEIATSALRRRALGCGVAARLFGRVLGRPSSNDFLAGLLHDVGELVLIQRCAEEGIMLPETLEDPDDGPVTRESLQYGHTAVGAALCRAWELPNAVAEAAAHHHDYSEQGKRQLLAQLAAATDVAMAHVTGVPAAVDPSRHPVLVALGMPPGAVAGVCAELAAVLPALTAIS
jgi:HD-like signal output (HDOD) protein